MNDKVYVEIFRRHLNIEMEGLTPIEINALAQRVHDKMAELSGATGIADSSKLAILAALHFAAELDQDRNKRSTEQAILERKLEELTTALRAALTHVPK